jgi:Ca2+-binding EF-hand superfamily protein
MFKVSNLLCFLAFALPIWCQPEGPGRGPMRSPAFEALDANHDGVISAAELANAATALKSLDKNGDGKLTEDEVRPQMGGRGRGDGPRGDGRRGGQAGEPGETPPPSPDDMVKTLMTFDKNGDGQLTRDELPDRLQGLFERADTDRNGILTADEIRKAAQSAAAPAARGGGEGRGPGGREGGRGNFGSFMRLDPILAALDTNGDGEISAEELAAAPQSLKKLDANGDGQLSAEEVRVNMGPGRGPGR